MSQNNLQFRLKLPGSGYPRAEPSRAVTALAAPHAAPPGTQSSAEPQSHPQDCAGLVGHILQEHPLRHSPLITPVSDQERSGSAGAPEPDGLSPLAGDQHCEKPLSLREEMQKAERLKNPQLKSQLTQLPH